MYTSLSLLSDIDKTETRDKHGKEQILQKRPVSNARNYYMENRIKNTLKLSSRLIKDHWTNWELRVASNLRHSLAHKVYSWLTLMKFKILFWMSIGNVYLGFSFTRLSLKTNSFFTIRDWKLGPQFCTHMSISWRKKSNILSLGQNHLQSTEKLLVISTSTLINIKNLVITQIHGKMFGSGNVRKFKAV